MKCFIYYWDEVVRDWLNGNIEQQQHLFINEKFLNLNPDHMPEPYWGNPMDCSLVIANYNPGGGIGRNVHTYRDFVTYPNCFISEVNKNGYFSVVKDFPIIGSLYGNNLQPNWWGDYEGSNWWLKKMNWLKSILSNKQKIYLKQKPPFAIEFCGWHSNEWPSNACTKLYKQVGLTKTIDDYFINTLAKAVQNSDAKLGICVGKQFYDLFKNSYTPHSLNINNVSSYYIYKFMINGADIIVLWGQGRNRFPDITPQKIP